MLNLYGKLPEKKSLLHGQLGVFTFSYLLLTIANLFQARNFFDSGDFALRTAQKSSDIGAIETGEGHPLRENVSHPASPVPGSSNVDKNADREPNSPKASTEAKQATNLHHTAS